MTLEQIQYFVASAEAGSFSAAAKQIFVSHSSVSRGVAALEKELGAELLAREARGLRLTAAGEVLYRQGLALIRQTVAMRDSMAQFRTRKQLHITSPGAYVPGFFELLRQFQAERPGVEVRMEQTDQRLVIGQLQRGETDLGVCFSYSWPEDPSLACMRVAQGAFCALLSPGHPLAGREYLTQAELTRDPTVLGENPFRPGELREEFRDIHSIILQIKTGVGITVLPEHAAAEFGQGCVQKPIRGAGKGYELLLGWRKENTSQALAEALAFFRAALAS